MSNFMRLSFTTNFSCGVDTLNLQDSEVIRLTFSDFKDNYNQRSFSKAIYRQSVVCPVQLMLD